MNNPTCHKTKGYPTISRIIKTDRNIQHQLEQITKIKAMDINKRKILNNVGWICKI